MIFDMKKEKLYRNLEDWVECNCPVEDCNDCPIGFNNNGKKCRCSGFVKLYADSALRLLWDSVKEVQSEVEIKKELEDMDMENMENMKENQMGAVEGNTPLLCRLLGVRPYQAFSYEGDDHRVFAIDENGVRHELDESGWDISYDEENLVKFIQHPERVVVLNEAQGLKDLARMHKAKKKLMKILPGVKAVEEFDGKVYVRVRTMKGTSELVAINLEMVEALEW